MSLTDQQVVRYSRHVLLPQVGGRGQRLLAQARVDISGTGPTAETCALYLVAAGIGTLHLDARIPHETVAHLRDLNPEVRVDLAPAPAGALSVTADGEGVGPELVTQGARAALRVLREVLELS